MNKKERKPLFSITKKDFIVQTFKSGGKGGQHQNTCESGARIIHSDSGAIGECRNFKSQYVNKKAAFRRLTESIKFKVWISKMMFNINGTDKKINDMVEASLNDKNLKIETKKDGKWKEEDK